VPQLGNRQHSQPFRADWAPASGARAVGPARDALERLVETAQVRNGLCPQRPRPLAFERDRCALGVVLVVGVGIHRSGDDAVELVDQGGEALQGLGTLNLQDLARTTVVHGPNLAVHEG
jgi:hypothetical protein